MAGLWEPSAGVFWRTPPTMPEEGGPLLAVIVCALIITIVGLVTARIARKVKEPGWHLRQHMVELGGAATLTYLIILVALTWGRAGALLTMPLNEVGDFLAGAFGPVAFLWLVLGFLQQGDELRQGTEALKLQAAELKNSVEQQSIMAAAATQQIDAQRAALQLQLDEVEKATRANFKFSSGSRSGGGIVGGTVSTSLTFGCAGGVAHDVTAQFDPPIGNVGICQFEEVSAARNPKVTLSFTNSAEDIEGVLSINYMGGDGKRRQENFRYSIRSADPWVKIKQMV